MTAKVSQVLEMLLFISVAIAILSGLSIIDKRSARAEARRRNHAHPWD